MYNLKYSQPDKSMYQAVLVFLKQKKSLCNFTDNQVKGIKKWKHMQKGREVYITLQIFQALYFLSEIRLASNLHSR